MRKQPLVGKCRCRTLRMVKGRKDYHCCECGIIIGKGTEHQKAAGVWGNSNLEFRTCPVCLDRWEELIAANPHFDFAPFNHGDLNEAIAYIEFQKAVDVLDRDRLKAAIKEYEPFAYGEMLEEVENAKLKILRLGALQELVEEGERLGLYEEVR